MRSWGLSMAGRQRIRVPGAAPRDAEIPEELPTHRATNAGVGGGSVTAGAEARAPSPLERAKTMLQRALPAEGGGEPCRSVATATMPCCRSCPSPLTPRSPPPSKASTGNGYTPTARRLSGSA